MHDELSRTTQAGAGAGDDHRGAAPDHRSRQQLGCHAQPRRTAGRTSGHLGHRQRVPRAAPQRGGLTMSVIYQADVLNSDGNVFDTLEVGGDDGSLPEIDMGPATAEEELLQMAIDTYGRTVRIGNVRVKGATG